MGNVLARFLSRGVLIGAVNMNVRVRPAAEPRREVARARPDRGDGARSLGIGGRIVGLAFGILFGGIVLALALAVGLGSKDLVTRSLERERTGAAQPEQRSGSRSSTCSAARLRRRLPPASREVARLLLLMRARSARAWTAALLSLAVGSIACTDASLPPQRVVRVPSVRFSPGIFSPVSCPRAMCVVSTFISAPVAEFAVNTAITPR